MCSLCQGLTAQVLPGSNDIKWTVFKLWLRIQLCTGSFRYFLFFFFLLFYLDASCSESVLCKWLWGPQPGNKLPVSNVGTLQSQGEHHLRGIGHGIYFCFRLLPPYTSQAENMRRRIRRHKLKRLRSCKRTICSA